MKFCFQKKDFIEQSIQAEKIAIIGSDRILTWAQFEEEVNFICEYFKENNWNHLSHPVIIYGHKEASMICCMYAMMKLNIAYIPIDIIYPLQRLITIKNVAEVEVILNCCNEALDLENINQVLVSDKKINSIQQTSVSVSDESKAEDPLIYIIFTSGSTGEPKGVQITTEAVRSFTKWMCADFGFNSDDVFINIAIFSFDLSVYEVMTFGALGASILLNDKVLSANNDELLNRIQKYKGTVWVSTPSFSLSYSRIGSDARLDGLKYFLFCGETLPHSTALNLFKSFPNSIIYNTYGPTEATVATTRVHLDKEILDTYNPLPVGYAKPECEIIIDKENENNKEGELIIVGKHVSIGYFKNEQLNKEKFFVHNGQRAFRTGDLAYIEKDMVFCLGRNDDQIKMHGFRIELDEISNTICKIAEVSDAVTVGLKRNNEVKKIVSFVILKNDIATDSLKEKILDTLKQSLPHYMIPGDIDFIAEFPYNASHKIDRNKLIAAYLEKQFNRN